MPLSVKDTIQGTITNAQNAATADTAGKLSANAGSTTQPVYFSGGKPVATSYTLAKSVPADAKFTDTNTWRGIQNNLTSDSTTDSLSAAQGKALKGMVDGKAATSHTHTKSQITDFPTSLPASDVYTWAKASAKPSYSWGEITGKPSAFTPSGHSHNVFGKATANAAGSAGFVPAPAKGQQGLYLRGDGIWATPTNTTYGVASQSANGLMSATDKKKLDAFGAAGTYATQTYVGQQIAAAGHITKTIVTSLPAVSDAKNNVIYMVKKDSGTSGNLYDEYMLIDGALEKVGDTETKISTLSNADVEEILGQI